MEDVPIVNMACLDLKSLGKVSSRQVVITSDEERRGFRILYGLTAVLCLLQRFKVSLRSDLFLQTESPGQQSKA